MLTHLVLSSSHKKAKGVIGDYENEKGWVLLERLNKHSF